MIRAALGFLLWLVLRVFVFVTRKPTFTFKTPDGLPYLQRWPLATVGRWPDAQGRTGGEGWYLHKIMRSDYERDLHNHPASSVAIPLRVGYIEQRYEHDARHSVLARLAATRWLRRLPLSVNVLTPSSFHRVELVRAEAGPGAAPYERECWSLFYIGPRSGKGWGFLQADGTVRRAAHHDGNTGAATARTDEVVL